MGKRNRKNKNKLSTVNEVKKDEIKEEILAEIKDKKEKDSRDKEEVARSDNDEKKDLLTEIVEEAKKEKEQEASGQKEGDGEAKEDSAKSDNDDKENPEDKKDKSEADKEKPEDDKEKPDETAAAIALDGPIPYIDSSVIAYKKKKKTGKLVAIISLSLIAAVYIGGLIYYSLFFYANTKINGIDVSGKSLEDAEKLVVNDMNTYSLEVDFSNGTEEIKVGDGGLTLSLKETMKDVKKKQQPLLWFMHYGKTYEYEVGFDVSYDENEMNSFILSYSEMQDQNMKKSKNAVVDMSSGVAEIIPDETGTELNKESVCEAVREALDTCDATVDIAEEGCYIEAAIQEDDPSVTNGLKQANDFLSIDAVYDFKGYKMSIPKEELAKMAYLDKDGNLQISKQAVYDYAARFTEKYSTVSSDRKFKTHDGKIIGVYGRNYGWIIDGEKEAEELYELICQKQSFVKEPACERSGYAMGDMNDIGYTYIEVDLTNQHLYFYEKGVLSMDTDVVTGWLNNPNNYKTPGGLYMVDNKAAPAVLVGVNYETPVNYWMGFNGGIGLHDATWRSQFGGDIYVYNGSHGCVNLPLSFAAEFYHKVEPGMPVVCYWRDEVEYYDE